MYNIVYGWTQKDGTKVMFNAVVASKGDAEQLVECINGFFKTNKIDRSKAMVQGEKLEDRTSEGLYPNVHGGFVGLNW